MKLQQINEMFDNIDIGLDVDAHHDDGAHYYSTVIDGETYEVNLSKMLPSMIHDNVVYKSLNIVGGRWSVTLRGPRGYDTTGKGNFGAVYGFLLGCIKDAIVNHNINALHFSGAEPGMDIVYNRLIKSFKRLKNPAFNFETVKGDLWISERGISMLDEESIVEIRQLIDLNDRKHNSELKSIRTEKNNGRNYAQIIRKLVMYNGIEYIILSADDDRPGVIGRPSQGDAYDYKYFSPEMINQLEIV